jgi:penicillin-binding protein 1A
VTIKTLLTVTPQAVVDLAQRFRIRETLQPYPSLALGCVDASLPEVAGMFNVFANHGTYVAPHLICWVKDRWGTKIYRHKPESESIISSRVSGQIAKVLMIGLERVRRRDPGSWSDGEAFGKTGTTNDSRTSWFIGSTPELTTVIYIGCDDNERMGNVFGVTTAFPIWKRLHDVLGWKKSRFSFDSQLREIIIDQTTGATLASYSPKVGYAIFV